MRTLFWWGSKLFYHSIEVNAPENCPPPGRCTILCPSHGNSLTDAIVVTATCPRMVRLTAKDSLWQHPFFSLFVRGVGTIPIQRRTEHGANADNTAVFTGLYKALEAGQCACLFPEGISRYMSGIAPLKSGVGRIALEVLRRRHAAGDLDFECTIVAMGITYLHREKFRSDVGVAFNEPIRLRAADYPELTGGKGGEGAAAKQIMARVARDLRRSSITAPTWEVARAAHAARRLYAPLGTRISLHQHIVLTQRFVAVFATMASEAADEARRKRSDSDPDLPEEEAAADSASERDLADLTQLSTDLVAYQDMLEELGVADERIRLPQPSPASLVAGIVLRGTWGGFLLALALPGTVLLSPLLVGGKLAEFYLQRSNLGPKLVRNMDEVAQYKMAVATVMTLPLTAASVTAARRLAGLPAAAALLAGPGLLWMTVRWLEDATACLRAGLEKFRLLLRPKTAALARGVRAGLVPRVVAVA
ncbi:unnamed protein product, partial [Phaeothamnion confervicola]